MNPRFLLIPTLVGLGVVAAAHAADPLRLDEAVARAIAANPALAAESASVRAMEARADRESLSPPWIIGGELENAVGTGDLGGIESAEATLRIGRVFELGGKRDARIALGSAEVRRQQHVAATARIDLAARTTARFIEVAADQQRLAFAQQWVQQAERTRREIAGWVSAARNPESDLRAAEITLADAELQREHAEHELASARRALSATWGAFAPDFDSVAADLRQLPEMPDFDDLLARLPMSSAERASLLEADEAQARRRIAEATAKPDVNVSVGVRRLEAVDDQGLVMSVSVPLGTRARASHAIAEVDAHISAIESRRQAQRFEAQQVLFDRYQELTHARTEHETLRTHMVPKAEQAVAFTRRGFQSGRFSFVALAQAEKTLSDLRMRSVEAAARYHTLLAEVERLTHVSAEPTP